jgi:peptide/nickel transport system substrate-binding protein
MYRVSRRTLGGMSAAMASGLVVPGAVLAQDSTPGADDASPMASPEASPVASPMGQAPGETIRSITREEFYEQLFAAFPFEEPQTEGGQVIWSQTSDISTVNGILSSDLPTAYVIGMIFEGLISTSPIDGTPVPGLADAWEIAEDGRTYTFFLNQNAKWHDGADVTAEDAQFSFDIALAEDSPNPRRGIMGPLLESYRVVDEHTFEMVARDTFATFLTDVSGQIPIMAKHIWEGIPPADWPNDPGSTGQDPSRVVGTGPFKFVEWRQAESVTLETNRDYWDPMAIPVMDGNMMTVLPDPATEVEALKAGEIDIVEVIPAPQTEEVQNTEGLEVAIFPNLGFSFYGFNLDPEKTTLFQDKEVRQALFIAIDKEAIRENIYLGFGEVPRGTQPVLSPAYDAESIEDPFEFDPERARELLASAGWEDTDGDGIVEKDGQPLSFTLTTSSGGGATTDQLLAEIQQRWRDIGVDMQPSLIEFPALVEIITNTFDFEVVLLGFNWSPDGGQGAMFDTESYRTSFNFMKYSNPEFDELEDQQLRELDPERRRQLLIQQSQIVWEDQPVGIYRFGTDRTGYSSRIRNYFPNGFGQYWSFPWVWIADE